MSFWDGTRWVGEDPRGNRWSAGRLVRWSAAGTVLVALALALGQVLAAGTASPVLSARTPAPSAGRVATAVKPPRPSPSPPPARSLAPTTKATGAEGGSGAAPSTSQPRSTPRPTPRPAPTPRLLFGLGTQAEVARATRIAHQAPIHMLSSWYNGPSDLNWMTDAWHQSIFDSARAAGYALHLITWSDVPETTFTASTGTVCGRPYPLSDRWLGDMRQLAVTFGGPRSGPPLYVTLFTEFQTYPCIDNAWNPNAQVNAYYRALIAQYEKGVQVFHRYAPNARVSLGWGGWQTRWDDPAIGGGRSMIRHFADAMRYSDFVSFQAMAGDSNVSDIRSMTSVLGAYGPVMLAHHMPDGDSNSQATVYAVFERDLRTLLTRSSIASLVDHGLFAWSFMDDAPIAHSSSLFDFVRTAVRTFGR